MTQKLNSVKLAPPKKIHTSCALIIVNPRSFQWTCGTHVLRSTQPMVSLLSPSVFAVSSNFLRVPFNIPRCSTRFSSTARPCAMYWSMEFSLSCRNVCSLSAKSSRAVG